MRNYWEESWERKERKKMERQIMLIRLALVLVIIAIGIVTLIRLDTVLMQQTETLNQLMELRQEVDAVETEVVEEAEAVSLGEYRISHYCVENYPHICNNGDSSQTASGEPPILNYTVAAADSIPFGTKLIISGTEYEVMDRGGAITEGRIDIAVSTHTEAIRRGILTREVWEVKQ